MTAPYWMRKVYEPEQETEYAVNYWCWYKMGSDADEPHALSWNIYSLLQSGVDHIHYRTYSSREEAMSDLQQAIAAAKREWDAD